MDNNIINWIGNKPFAEIKISNLSYGNILIEVDSRYVADNGNGITSSVKTSKCVYQYDSIDNSDLLDIIKNLYDKSKNNELIDKFRK